MKKIWHKLSTSAKVFVITTVIVILDLPFLLFSEVGSQADRIGGFVLEAH